MYIRLKAKSLIEIHTEFRNTLLGNAAAGQHLFNILFGNQKCIRNLAFLVQNNTLSQFLMDGLHHIHAAFLSQSIAEDRLKGSFLLIGGLGGFDIENALHKTLPIQFDIAGIKLGIVEIGCPTIKGRKQKAKLRTGNSVGNAAIVEQLFLRHVMKCCLGQLYRANSAKDKLENLAGILLFKGHIVAVAAQKNQIGIIHGDGFHHLFVKLHPQIPIFKAGAAQLHEQLMLGTVGDLGSLERNVDQMLADCAGKCFTQHGEILVSLIFRHHAGAGAKFRDNFLAAVDIAAINGSHITAVTANMPPDLRNFLYVHISTSHIYVGKSGASAPDF